LHDRDVPVRHILADGTIEGQDDTERRLVAAAGLAAGDLFAAGPLPRDLVSRAYALRSAKRAARR
jgi:hypothetical protein